MADDEQLAYLRECLDVQARCGYGTDEEVIDSFIEQVQEELDLWEDEDALMPWKRACRDALASQRQRENGWSGKSHNDRIEEAFAALTARGVLALEDAGYTMSDGWSDIAEARESYPDTYAGVFFHRQDVEGALNDTGLMLAFGAFTDGPEHEAASLKAAKLTCQVLEEHGVATEWNGSIDSRIVIKPFEWRKRRYTTAG